MNRIAKRLINMTRPKYSVSKGVMFFALGAAIGAGAALLRDQRPEYHAIEDGGGPVEADL